MRLPNAHLAMVERDKIVQNTLLNTEHFYGASKARFFNQFGFNLRVLRKHWRTLYENIGQLYEVSRTRERLFWAEI